MRWSNGAHLNSVKQHISVLTVPVTQLESYYWQKIKDIVDQVLLLYIEQADYNYSDYTMLVSNSI